MRILPAYLTVLFIYFTVPQFKGEHGINPLWNFLTFTTNLFGEVEDHLGFLATWSLCIEEHFYLLFPIVLIFIKKPTLRTTVIICTTLVVFGIVTRACLWIHHVGAPYRASANPAEDIIWPYFTYIYLPTYNRLDGLLAGVVLAGIQAFRHGWWQVCMEKANVILFIGMFVLAISLVIVTDEYSFLASVIGFPMLSLSFALIVLAANSSQTILGSFKIPFATSIAALAYSLYLTHIPIFEITTRLLNKYDVKIGIQTYLIYIATSFIFASLLYLCVERPFLKMRDYMLKSNLIPSNSQELYLKS